MTKPFSWFVAAIVCLMGCQGGAEVAVHVTDSRSQPVAGARVVVHDAAGAVSAQALCDGQGQVTVRVPEHGSIAASYSADLAFETIAVLDPPDGATVHLTLELATPKPALPEARTMYDVAVSSIPSKASTMAYYTCSPEETERSERWNGSTTYWATDNWACPSAPAVSVLAVALQGPINSSDTDHPLAWGLAVDQPVAAGTYVPVALPLSHTDFDPPLAASIVATSEGATEAYVELAPLLQATVPVAYTQRQWAPVVAFLRRADWTFLPTPHGIFASYGITEHVTMTSGSSETYVERRRRYAALPAHTEFRADAMALVSVDPVDLADPVHPAVRWSVTEGPRGDLGRATLEWRSGTATHRYTVLFAPDHTTELRLSSMPAEWSSYAPRSGDRFTPARVEYIDEEDVSGFAQSSLFLPHPPVDGLGEVVSGGQAEALSGAPAPSASNSP